MTTPTNAWRLHLLLAAPHRLGFFGGALMLSVSGLWWAGQLFARATGIPVAWAIAPSTAHGLLMALGFMPLFFVGFLFTAGPKWLQMPEVSARDLLPHVLATLVGWAVCMLGFHWHTLLCAVGMLLVSTAWCGMIWKFFLLWRHSPASDRHHAGLVVLSCVWGSICMVAITIALLLGKEDAVRVATQGAIWFFLATTFAVVSHRMIPFFSASAVPGLDAWRPMWLMGVMVAVLWLEGTATCLNFAGVRFDKLIRFVQVALESGFAMLMLWLAIRWGLMQSLKIRLLAMLHGGFLWLGIAMALQAFSHTLMALSNNEVSLGLAPLHALTTGYLGATLFAMATRVSSGHSGRPLAADNTVWLLYWTLQLAIFSRVASALMPASSVGILLFSSAMWVLATTGWALRYGSWFLRPRVDGRMG